MRRPALPALDPRLDGHGLPGAVDPHRELADEHAGAEGRRLPRGRTDPGRGRGHPRWAGRPGPSGSRADPGQRGTRAPGGDGPPARSQGDDPDDARGGLAQRGGCIGSGVLRDPVRRDPAVELEPPAVLRVTGSPAVHPIRRASDIAQQRVALGAVELKTAEEHHAPDLPARRDRRHHRGAADLPADHPSSGRDGGLPHWHTEDHPTPDEVAAWIAADSLYLALDADQEVAGVVALEDRKSTRLNSSHVAISYAVFCLKKKKERAE